MFDNNYIKRIKEALEEISEKKLSAKQKKHMDTDKDGDVDAKDLANLRNENNDEESEEKVECPKCKGKGCKHCDGKGYHEKVDEAVEQVDELKKSTYASYLQKAPGSLRGATGVAKDFDRDYARSISKAVKHYPNNLTPSDSKKDPKKLKKHEKDAETNKFLRDIFRRNASNRKKGIERAGRLLSKEDVEFTEREYQAMVDAGVFEAKDPHTKGAHPPEMMHDRWAVGAKKFADLHDYDKPKLVADDEKGHEDARKAGGPSMKQSPARKGDNLSNGDTKNPKKQKYTEEG